MNIGDEHNGRYALPCTGCGRPTWQALPTTQVIRCRECLVTHHGVPRSAWRKPVDITPRGASWPGERGQRDPVDAASTEPTHDILTPSRPATEDEAPPAAWSLYLLALEHGREPYVTYALARARKDGALVRTACVRFRALPCVITPHATYINGYFESAWWPGDTGMPVRVGSDAVRDLVAGLPVPVAQTDACSRCGRPDVRMTKAGAPYAHNRPDSKVRCVDDASVDQ